MRPVNLRAGAFLLPAALLLAVTAACPGGGGGAVSFKIITDVLPDGSERLPYSVQIEVKGGKKPLTWSVSSGTLPTGITLDAAAGLLSGTPAPGTNGSSPYNIQIQAADSKKTPKVVTKDYVLVVNPPGGYGGGPAQGTITVVVLAEETLQPIQGAFVMVGSAPDVPFTNNFGLTDAMGIAVFTDPYLDNPVSPPPVTAGAAMRQYLTVYGAAAAGFVMPLKELSPTTNPSRIDGFVTGQNLSPQLNFHAGIVMPPVRITDLFDFSLEKFFVGEECACLACEKYALPGNLSYPTQDLINIIAGDEVPQKDYFMEIETGRSIHLAVTAGFIDVGDILQILAGGNPNILEIFTRLQVEGFGIIPDYTVTGPAVVDIPITIGLGTPVDATVLTAPRGADVFLAAAVELDGALVTGQVLASDFGFIARDQAIPRSDTLSMVPDSIPGLAAPPRKMIVAAAFFDPASGVMPLPPPDTDNAFSILAERIVSPSPGGVQFESFLDLMPVGAANITNGGSTFTYASAQDPGNPLSPVPHYTVTQITRVWSVPGQPLTDPYPGQFCEPTGDFPDCDDLGGGPPSCPLATSIQMSETFWETYTRGSGAATTFDLPTLPPSAPRAADGGTFDPTATPEFDIHEWTVLSFHVGTRPSFDYNSLSFSAVADEATHVSLNSTNY